MKKTFLASALLALCFVASAADKDTKAAMKGATKVVWAGIDFSMVRLIDPKEFNDPSAIFPGYLETWNNLFVYERIPHVELATKKLVVIDIAGVMERNKTATSKQIILTPGDDDTIKKTHITEQDIAQAVQSYKMENKSGLAAVFIVDRFIKQVYQAVRGNQVSQGAAAVYVVFFDIYA